MAFKITLSVFVALSAASASVAPVPVAVAKISEDTFDPNPSYSFAYNVQDALTGDSKGHIESRANGVVQGQYNLADSDGTRRIVDYTADPINGFNALVRKEPLTVAASPVIAARTAQLVAAPAAPVIAARVAPVVAAKASPVVAQAAPLVAQTARYVAQPAPVFAQTAQFLAQPAPVIARAGNFVAQSAPLVDARAAPLFTPSGSFLAARGFAAPYLSAPLTYAVV